MFQVQLKSRELNKLKATHMKLMREMQQLTTKVAQQEEQLSMQRAASERQQLQETRLQATISQQGKLIDYLQGVGRSPEAKGLGRLKVGIGPYYMHVDVCHMHVDITCMLMHAHAFFSHAGAEVGS